MNNLDWNHERHRTRDLLLEYDISIMPARPRAAGLTIVYPWENSLLQLLGKQLYNIAANSGFSGTEEDFNSHFGEYLNSKQIIFSTYNAFPQVGEIDKLYFDQTDKILYYWNNEYIPVNAMLIANTTLEGGGA